MDITNIWKYDLRKGNSTHPSEGACLFDAGMWLVYGRIGDNPPCSCPIIRSYAIGLNDLMPDAVRSRLLKPYILRVVGNRDSSAEKARLRLIVLETARHVVPLASNLPSFSALRGIPDDASFSNISKTLQAAVNAVNAAIDAAARAADAARTSNAARAVNAAARAVNAVVYAAARTSNAARAVVCAAEAAGAAEAAARAAYDAARAVVYAAEAAGAAARAAYDADATDTAAAAKVWETAVSILDEALRIGKQSPEFDETEVRQSVKEFELAAQFRP